MSESGRSFDAVADDYLRARSAYPDEMIRHIIDTAALEPGSRVLDVGCGSGQATIEFAARGYSVVAIDPAMRALELLAERCAAFPQVELVHTTLEEFQPATTFDLVICAQAFHWLDLETASRRISELLQAAGHVMLFWHMQDIMPSGPQSDLYRMAAKYFDTFPVMNPPEYSREFLEAMLEALCRHEDIGDARIVEYPWRQDYEKAMFQTLQRSSSMYARLGGTAKVDFDRDLAEYLAGLGSDPVIHYRTCLVQARKRQTGRTIGADGRA